MIDNNQTNEEKKAENRFKIIDEFFKDFQLLYSTKQHDSILDTFRRNNEVYKREIKKNFDDLEDEEIYFILFSFTSAKDKNPKNLINILDTLNTILSHYHYYITRKNTKIKFNNTHFDNYLIKRYECSYIFTTFLSENGCRALKINNKLFFNYMPVSCTKNDKKEDCPFAHNENEKKYHPFVYKKFKCYAKVCEDENCPFYHINDDNEPIDMETEVDFDSEKMIDLLALFSCKNLNQEDSIGNEKLELYLQKKEKESGDFLPSEFNPLTYKIYKCPLGPICKLDKKLCLNYHGLTDRRRNPKYYKPKLCPNLFEKSKRIPNSKCIAGDNCQNAHNLYEYFYHPDKFRTKECPNEKEKKKCIERLICPYYHETDSDCGNDGFRIMIDKDLITNYYKSIMINYEKLIDEEKQKLRNIEKKYLCSVCGNHNTNALNSSSFRVDVDNNKIICNDCSKKKKSTDISWQ